MIYDELPKELSRLFGDILIPAEIRELIIKGWDCMIPNEQAQLELKLLNEQDKEGTFTYSHNGNCKDFT